MGYKYIWCDTDLHNWDLYLDKAKNGEMLRHSELKDGRGHYDEENAPGVYFCETLGDLLPWVKECLSWSDPAAVEILEVSPFGFARERFYADGRKALIADSCKVRVLKDSEIPQDMDALFKDFFG